MWADGSFAFDLLLEFDVGGLSVKHSVDLLVCPAEYLLVEVPEINHEQDTDGHRKHLKGFFANIAHIACSPLRAFLSAKL